MTWTAVTTARAPPTPLTQAPLVVTTSTPGSASLAPALKSAAQGPTTGNTHPTAAIITRMTTRSATTAPTEEATEASQTEANEPRSVHADAPSAGPGRSNVTTRHGRPILPRSTLTCRATGIEDASTTFGRASIDGSAAGLLTSRCQTSLTKSSRSSDPTAMRATTRGRD